MLIRAYDVADLGAIHTINEAEVPAVGAATLDHLDFLVRESAIVLVAEIDGEVVGFALVLTPDADYESVNYRWFCDRYDDFVYLDRVAISPRFQRRGVGRAMYAEVERVAVELRPTATEFALEVNLEPRNDQSLAFHAQLGFLEVGQQRTDYGAVVSLMTKPLGTAT